MHWPNHQMRSVLTRDALGEVVGRGLAAMMHGASEFPFSINNKQKGEARPSLCSQGGLNVPFARAFNAIRESARSDCQKCSAMHVCPAGGDRWQPPRVEAKGGANESNGLVPESIGDKRVLVIGCGSVGSSTPVRARAVRRTSFWTLRPRCGRMGQMTYRSADVGRPKVEALQDGLLNVFPAGYQDGGIDCSGLDDSTANWDLIVCAVDDPAGWSCESLRHAGRMSPLWDSIAGRKAARSLRLTLQ